MIFTDYTGQILSDRYRILERLGVGGMGAVYLGEHIVIRKKVAIKFLHSHHTDDESIVKRFYREAQVAVAIHHKNIIDVMDMGISAVNEPYLVMEYLEGESLADLIEREERLSLPAACGVMEPVLQALDAAHSRGVIHRDLKPDNIFIVYEPDEKPLIKIIDFGISKMTGDEHTRITQTGALLGTPSYMSPEQIQGNTDIDHRTDLYALGVILYQMLTGKLPYEGAGYNAVLLSIMTDEPKPPEEAFADFPIEIKPLLLSLLDKNPDNRPATALDLLEQLTQIANYNDRYQHLSISISNVTNRTFAAGDLGEEIDTSNKVSPHEVLSDLIRKNTPIQPRAKGSVLPRGPLGLAAMAVVLVALTAGLTALITQKKKGGGNAVTYVSTPITTIEPQPISPHKPEKVSVKKLDRVEPPLAASPNLPTNEDSESLIKDSSALLPRRVQLSIEGAPPQARFHLNGENYDSSPFQATQSSEPAQLTVTAPGFQDFSIEIVPDEDHTYSVSLMPTAQPPEPSRKISTEKTEPEETVAISSKQARQKNDVEVNKNSRTERRPLAPSNSMSRKNRIRRAGKVKYTERFDD